MEVLDPAESGASPGGGSGSSRSKPPRSSQTTPPGISIRIQEWLQENVFILEE